VKNRCEPSRRRWLASAASTALWPLAGTAWLPTASHAQQGSGGHLARIRERGSLMVGLYQDMPPFHVDGRGIDLELGQALAEAMGLRFSALPFHAGENMGDDLRNMVWKGHYLGWGPADVLLHVSVERALTQANPQVLVLAPYYRDKVLLAVRADRLGQVDNLAQLQGHPVAVAGQSLAGWVLAGAMKEGLVTAFADGSGAARALQAGEADAAAGLASELESVLAGDPRFVLQPMPSPRVPAAGWAVGCAVRHGADELAAALQTAMQSLQGDGRLSALFARHHVNWHL
jgi:Bacterial extracellular solute-binding proteins, family 3